MDVSVKVCGLRRPEDAREAMSLGADFGGVIAHPASPRYVAPGTEEALLAEIPKGKRVWVAVEPDLEAIEAAFARGFDWVQIHFDPSGDFDPVSVSTRFGASRLWLVPRLANLLDFNEDWVGLAKVILIDGFSKDRMGGTGHRVEGESFAKLQNRHPEQRFSIAGGITPENVGEVLRSSEAAQIDVSSGVESSPGNKDASRLRALFQAVRQAEE
ncbi:phosphoribosylanthranilate isomerase [Puniceicoccus vermicola]|uniref:N-(5'-phosphoribosyl)anthranilate isomerase n=1 Tax=Puniceicoccus vermicola TaxID=388746 RepID=A0A7X1E491_9BACT|nr:phosphoribosylanthranilate isomerase [Puniceicoccus vermicola]MBC2602330.1 phosphoribosylanthranilate isomerase [Puniceicoccus vermicola]